MSLGTCAVREVVPLAPVLGATGTAGSRAPSSLAHVRAAQAALLLFPGPVSFFSFFVWLEVYHFVDLPEAQAFGLVSSRFSVFTLGLTCSLRVWHRLLETFLLPCEAQPRGPPLSSAWRCPRSVSPATRRVRPPSRLPLCRQVGRRGLCGLVSRLPCWRRALVNSSSVGGLASCSLNELTWFCGLPG